MERDPSASAGSEFSLTDFEFNLSAGGKARVSGETTGGWWPGCSPVWRGPGPPRFFGSLFPWSGREELGGTRDKGVSVNFFVSVQFKFLDHIGPALR